LVVSVDEYIQAPPFSSGPHFLCCLALLPLQISHHDIEDLLAERGITVSREAIRLWCIKFGAIFTRRLKCKHRGYGDTF
jgi:transposase-like protein